MPQAVARRDHPMNRTLVLAFLMVGLASTGLRAQGMSQGAPDTPPQAAIEGAPQESTDEMLQDFSPESCEEIRLASESSNTGSKVSTANRFESSRNVRHSGTATCSRSFWVRTSTSSTSTTNCWS